MIEGCQEISDFGRAAEWTAALSGGASEQPGLVAFTGQCAVHRGQIMRLRGAFRAGARRARRARSPATSSRPRPARPGSPTPSAARCCGMRGELDAAEESYERAADHGYEPQPGLALLWLARGRTEAASPRSAGCWPRRPTRCAAPGCCPAAVEVLLAGGRRRTRRARRPRELERDRRRLRLRRAARAWRRTRRGGSSSPTATRPARSPTCARRRRCGHAHGGARTRRRGCGCRSAGRCAALGDDDVGDRELAAARARLRRARRRARAADEVARLLAPDALPDGLTAREAEVLRLVASGRSNAQIAADLVLSEKTVARHLSNIFTKIDVGSRTAAAAYAFEHGLA